MPALRVYSSTMSISRKLTLTVVFACSIAVLTAGAAILILEALKVTSKTINELNVVADITGRNCSASLVFDDRDTAADILASLGKNPAIRYALILDRNKNIFTQFSIPGLSPKDIQVKVFDGHTFDADNLHICRPIILDSERIGSIYVASSLKPLKSELIEYLSILASVLILSIASSLFLSSRLQRNISEPLLRLAGTAREVTASKDYGIRFWEADTDETAQLAAAFNDMLEEIQKRDDLLEANRRDLEEKVALRTEELKIANESLLNSRKLESIGVLAGGIAHDFNNYLMSILGNISLAHRLSPPGKFKERLDQAEKAAFRARDLTKQLLTFSKGGLPVRKIASLSNLIHEAVSITLAGSNVKAEIDIPPALSDVYVDESQLIQVVSNILLNASHSMPSGGRILIRAWDSCNTSVCSANPDSSVCFSIEDTGCGIPEEHLHRIFDPYFSTKDQGSGLGLATCHSIIKNHGGTIAVKSIVGMGTTFTVCLPKSGDQLSIPHEIPDKEARSLASPLRILVMDDEESILETTGLMLDALGFESSFAKEGAEALEIFRKAADNGKPFDIVIIDLTIPGGMGGEEANRLILELNPDARTIVSSGYSDSSLMANYRNHGFSGILPKPYRIEDLEKTINASLSSAR